MSRCFPYPSRGYTLSNTPKAALIESIKPQKEKLKAEEPRKEDKKREKKEKRKEKKLKKIQNLDKSNIVQSCIGENVQGYAKVKFSHKGGTGENLPTYAKVKFSHKGGEADSEQLERSNLTEEHEKPVCLRVPSSSSDSTENSNKRKRPSSPLDVGPGRGKIIRIRLTSKKQDHESDVSANEQKLSSMSGMTHGLTSMNQDQSDASANEQKLCSTSGTTNGLTSKKQYQTDSSTNEQKLCSTSGMSHRLTSKRQHQSDVSANEQKLCSAPGTTHRPTSKRQYQSDASATEQKLCSPPGTTHKPTSKRQYQSDASANEQKLCSTSGRMHSASQLKDDSALRHRSNGFRRMSDLTNSIGQGLLLREADSKQMCSTSKQIGIVAAGKTITSSVANAVMTPMQREELLYRNLIENWVPPQMQDACLETEDQDWLFPAKRETVQPEKRQICRDDMSSSTSTLWPRAQHLPEVDLYALPFTVPF